ATNEDYLDIITSDNLAAYVGEKLSVYPNPTTNLVTIEAPSEIKRISLLSNQGKLLVEQKLPVGNSSSSVDLSRFSSGFYTLVIEFSQGGILYRKIMRL
ncbi:MAG TPA: T9SS type A sorting domain-containing protein, partial [Cryomorphaceae bacterium]|nr:T9SS type A sorting domain-containing protein [Cryomorphaceae bacterium]